MPLSTQQLPRARQEQLVIQELPDEVLVYDLERHTACCLNRSTAQVWQHCDGRNSAAEIARRLAQDPQGPISEEVVWLALRELEKFNLLQERCVPPQGSKHVSRREAIRTLGIAAATLPLIVGMAVPTAAQAGGSCLPIGAACSTQSQCCSSNCNNSVCGPEL